MTEGTEESPRGDADPVNEAIQDRVEYWREKRGLSESAFAVALGLHRTTYNKLKKHKIRWRLPLLLTAADVLDRNVGELLFGEDYALSERERDLMVEVLWTAFDALSKSKRMFSDYDARVLARFLVRECLRAVKDRAADKAAILEMLDPIRR